MRLMGLSHCEYHVQIFEHNYEGSHEFGQNLVKITFAGYIRIVQNRYEIIRNPTTRAMIDVRQHPYICDTVRFIS